MTLRQKLFLSGLPRKTRRGIKNSLENINFNNPSSLIKDIKARAKNIINENQGFIKDSASRGHLSWSSHVLAAYQELAKIFPDEEERIEFLKKALKSAFNTKLNIFLFSILLKFLAFNPKRAKNFFNNSIKAYGKTFKSSVYEANSPKGVVMEITQCFFFDFFKSHGVPKLTTVLCQIDSLWLNLLDEKKHGMFFDKSQYITLGYGDEKCVLYMLVTDRF